MTLDSTDRARSAKRLFPLIARRLDSIPAPPAVLLRVSGLLAAPDLSSRDMTEIVRVEPSLTARVLRVINSPFFGLGPRVSTVSHAVALLGPEAVRRIAGGISVFGSEVGDAGDLSRLRWFRHSVSVAAAAEVLAGDFGFDLPEEAYVAGLLHDLGRIVLGARVLAKSPGDTPDGRLRGRAALERERARNGMDHCRAGALVAERWNLPEILRDAVELHHEEAGSLADLPPRNSMLVGIVAAADRICDAHGLACEPGAEGEDPGRIVVGDRIPGSGEVARAIAGAEAALADLARRLGCGRDLVGELSADSLAARRTLVGRRRERPLADRLGSLEGILRQIRRGSTREEMLSRAVALCQGGLDFDRVVFFEMGDGTGRLVGRFHSGGTRIEVNLPAISLPIAAGGPIGAAIRDGTPVRLDNWATDGGLLDLLGHTEAVLAPVSAGPELLGLICADCSLSSRDLTDADVTLLGLLAGELGLAEENRMLHESTKQLRALSIKDELTAVNNRRNLMERLAGEIDRAMRYDSPLCVVMVDIDDFKAFNDTLGHLAGDAALTEVAQLIVSSSREVDVIGRYGGEEFLVVLPETYVDQGIVYSERLRKVVEEWSLERVREGSSCPITISVGVTEFRRESDDLESLLRRVDAALYAAKGRGRNRVCVA
ncbi:MAG: diguanylate cyclase [Planctomycetes bacterium]|jgi:diguanylate cyclase (GGDEF)-like protein/putative nucleotidyltransferase with HDIG domain|nr:diguanylate cyclase [Planctomycetota bacterium]